MGGPDGRRRYYENIKTAQEFINRELPWLDAYVPDGTYLMWIGYGRTGLSEEDMRRLLEERGIVPDFDVELLTRNEASRMADRILAGDRD